MCLSKEHQHFMVLIMNFDDFSKLVEKSADSINHTNLNQTNKKVRNSLTQSLNFPRVSDKGLNEYQGNWDFAAARHLLSRAMFGPQKSEIEHSVQLGLNGIVDRLLEDSSEPEPPLNINVNDTEIPMGETWVNGRYNPLNEPFRVASLRAWWAGLIINQDINLREKMTLFWHNHFVTEILISKDSRYSYKYSAFLRKNSLGNFRDLAEGICIQPAMIEYLNGNTNQVGKPNENFARELFELFTIGKGPQRGPGDYTNYNEDDVIEAARVLTGWQDNKIDGTSYFRSARHDRGSKNFSENLEKRVIHNNNDLEYKDLITMILDQDETARFICRNLYRWFVYYEIDDFVEENIIVPLGKMLKIQNYELRPVLRTLFKSEHFNDVSTRGAVIKNPLEFIAGVYRQFEVKFPENDFLKQYIMWYAFGWYEGYKQEMALGDPPGVAGWSAYYQEPLFYRIWINSVTMPSRTQFSDLLASRIGLRYEKEILFINPIEFLINNISQPEDPNMLIKELSDILIPIELTENQKNFLKDTLIPGLPDYEWAEEWNEFMKDPDNQVKLLSILDKLHVMMRELLSMAEYHLN